MDFSEIYPWAVNQVQNNQFLITALFGAGLFLLRRVPVQIVNFIKRVTSIRFELNVEHDLYEDLLEFLDDKRLKMFSRNFSIKKGSSAKVSVGYGSSYFRYGRVFGRVYREKLESVGYSIKEIATLTLYTRRSKVLKNLIKECYENRSKNKGNRVLVSAHDYWRKLGKLIPRPIDSVFAPDGMLQKIRDQIRWFLENEQWFVDRGINYKYGVLLHGQPGTGKSSIARALTSDLGRDLYVCNLNRDIDDLGDLLSNARKGIVLFEDVDAVGKAASSNRKAPRVDPIDKIQPPDRQGREPTLTITNSGGNRIDLQTMLNVTDGPLTPHGLIYFATTNHLDELDPALIRPGRIDLICEVPAISRETFADIVCLYYGQDARLRVVQFLAETDFKEMNGAAIQQTFFAHLEDIEGFLAEIKASHRP